MPQSCKVHINNLCQIIGVYSKGIEVDHLKVKSICELQPPTIVKEAQTLLGRLNYIARFISRLSKIA